MFWLELENGVSTSELGKTAEVYLGQKAYLKHAKFEMPKSHPSENIAQAVKYVNMEFKGEVRVKLTT